MKRIVILGAGTGGTIVANKLARRLDTRQWEIVVVDGKKLHVYQPGLLFVPFGIYQMEDVVKPRRQFLSRRVNFILDDVELIDPQAGRVRLAGRSEPISYDHLVIATGCDIAPEETPGLNGKGWQKNIFDFYTLVGATALQRCLRDWPGGRLVLNVAEMPIKCPVAPLEFLFLADWYFRNRGIRSKVELAYATPLSNAFTKPKAAAALKILLERKDIQVIPDFAVSEVDNEHGKLRSYDNKEVPFDLLVTIPVNKGANVIGHSNMGDELNYVETDKQTLRSKQWPNVWVIGDASDAPTAKAGSVAHFMADVLVENLCRAARGETPSVCFDGHANCFIETGFNRAVLIDYNYANDPQPGRFPFPRVGPFALLQESVVNHWGKLACRRFYWDCLLPGRLPGIINRAFAGGAKI